MKTRLLIGLWLALCYFNESFGYTLSGTTLVCKGETATYCVDYYGCTPISWGAGGDMVILSNYCVQVTWTTTGTKHVTATSQWMQIQGCNDNFDLDLIVTVNDRPSGPTVSTNNGNSEICSDDSWSYSATLTGYSTSYGYDWYATGGLLINGSSSSSGSPIHTSTNSVTVTPGTGYGDCSIYVRLNNGNNCPGAYGYLARQVGPYSSSQFYINGPSSACPGAGLNFSPSLATTPVTGFQWSAPGDWSPTSSTSQNFYSTVPWSFSGGVVALQLQNRCGWTGSPSTKYVGSMSCFGFMASPNPTTSSIEITDATGGATLEDGVVAQLTNDRGKIVAESRSKDGSVILNTENVPDGLYILEVSKGSQVETKRIFVHH
jgi:hypothetical protein